MVCNFQRDIDLQGCPVSDENGDPVFLSQWEKKRADYMPSWWSKLMVTVEYLSSGKGAKQGKQVLSVEYSVAKWYNVTNGVNRGVVPSFNDCFKPVWDCLEKMNILDYTHYCKNDFIYQVLLNHIILRRLDLSYCFKTSDVKKTLTELATCRLNNQDGRVFQPNLEVDTVTWGRSKSSRGSVYKIMWYNKEAEQKAYFNRSGVDCSKEIQSNKRIFYKKHFDKFSNVARFEIQYSSKFFLSHFKSQYKDKKDLEMFDNILKLCTWNWQEHLKKFDEQLNMVNVRPECEYQSYQQILDKLDSLRIAGGISRTKCANLSQFVTDCFKRGWVGVWSEMGKTNFGFKYREIKKLTKFDLKRVCLSELPIMRIIATESYNENFRQNLVFESGFIGSLAV